MAIAVYILTSDRNKIYCGITNNIKRRLYEHQTGKSKYTSKCTGWRLRYLTSKSTRKEARKLEVEIKKFGVRKWYNREMLKSKATCHSII